MRKQDWRGEVTFSELLGLLVLGPQQFSYALIFLLICGRSAFKKSNSDAQSSVSGRKLGSSVILEEECLRELDYSKCSSLRNIPPTTWKCSDARKDVPEGQLWLKAERRLLPLKKKMRSYQAGQIWEPAKALNLPKCQNCEGIFRTLGLLLI